MDPANKRTIRKWSSIVFWTLQILAHISGIALLVATGVWVSKYFGGFNWGKFPGTFSYHAFFGVLGLVVICGEGMKIEIVITNKHFFRIFFRVFYFLLIYLPTYSFSLLTSYYLPILRSTY